MTSDAVDILEDPDGAPYPEPVQRMWDALGDAIPCWTEPTRETVVAALESVAAERDATIARLEAEVGRRRIADADILMACSRLDWATDGRPETTVRHVREVSRLWQKAEAEVERLQRTNGRLHADREDDKREAEEANARADSLRAEVGDLSMSLDVETAKRRKAEAARARVEALAEAWERAGMDDDSLRDLRKALRGEGA